MAATDISDISDGEKDLLQNHLEDLKFLDDCFKMKGYCCCACRKLAIRHCIANCGDVFCNNCYFEHYMKPCPYCKDTVETNSQDLVFERAVFEFKVKCKFTKNGCEEILELRNFLNHINGCEYSTEKLLPKLYKEDPNSDAFKQLNDDVNRIKQVMESLQEDNRRICYEFQGIKDVLKNCMDAQAATFKKLTDEFCNKGNADLMRVDIMQLKKDLMKNEEAGKGLTAIELQNKKATELMQSEIIHLKSTLKKSEEIAKELQAKHGKMETNQRQHLEELETKLKAQFRIEITESLCLYQGDVAGSLPVVIHWKVSGIQELLHIINQDTSFSTSSEEFFNITDELQFKPILWTYSKTKWVSIRVEFNSDLKEDSLPYLHSRKYILLDQSDASEKNNMELIDRPNFDMNSNEEMMVPNFNQCCFFPVCFLKGENPYLKNDQILIRIIFQPTSFLYNNVASSDGTLIWCIKNYSKKKQDEIDRVKCRLISEPFKTSEMGYLLQTELYLNGYKNGKGKFLSIFSRVIVGENDADLPCPFTYKCSFYLLDQSDFHLKNDISKCDNSVTVDEINQVWGFHQFVLQSQVEDKKYLKGDCLLIKVVAEVL